MTAQIQCHYEVLGVPRDADAATIKKHHRKMALKFHPDKNLGDGSAAEKFLLVQQAYECLGDVQERKWYDDHREAILAGWSASDSPGNMNILFDVVHFMHPGCYSGYHTETGGFYNVYETVFENIVQCDRKQTETIVDLPTDFGDANSVWSHVLGFYQVWESFVSSLNFAWEDKYNVHEDAPNRRVKRLMEEENKKARRAAKKTYNQDIWALVAFIKRRDPRVKAKQEEMEQQKIERQQRQKEEAIERKKEQKKAKEAWKEEAQRAMEEAEEADRLAGRVRLADLEDDYDYGGGKKKRGKGKKKKNKGQAYHDDEDETNAEDPVNNENPEGEESQVDISEEGNECGNNTSEQNDKDISNHKVEEAQDEDVVSENDSNHKVEEAQDEDVVSENDDITESSEEPDVWRCECCRKDFKSEGQMENHMKSKKHKEAFKKHQAKLKKKEEELMSEIMDDLKVNS